MLGLGRLALLAFALIVLFSVFDAPPFFEFYICIFNLIDQKYKF
jgi:hypothetical protein